jgi:hypothetical protein
VISEFLGLGLDGSEEHDLLLLLKGIESKIELNERKWKWK